MNLLGNIVWLLLGGLALSQWNISFRDWRSGLTIVGIPFGIQALKLGLLALLPFGQTSVRTDQGTGCLYTLMNVIWFFLGGIWIVLTHLLFGALLFITIVGIPFGRQHFKLMSMALTPFGRNIVPTAAL